MNLLLVNADDFGLHASVNSAIADCVDFGSVNSVSVIANGAAPNFELLHKFVQNGIFVGIHITWIEEPWLTNSMFISSWKVLFKKMILGGKEFQLKMQQEAEAQMARFLEAGIYPDHIDSHQHVHHFASAWNIVSDLKKKYAVKRIRVAHVKSPLLLRKNISGFTLNGLAGLKQQQNNSFYCAGIKYSGNYNTLLFERELHNASGSDTELIVHPGKSNVELNKIYPNWNYHWEEEFTALMKDSFIRSIGENNFGLLKK